MTILFAIGLVLVGMLLARKSPVIAIYTIALLIPTYIVKLSIGPLPTTMVELLIWGVAIGWIITAPKTHLSLLLTTLRPIFLPILLLLISLIIGVVVSTDLRMSLGIVKGWFFDPILVYALVVAILKPNHIKGLVTALLLSTIPLSLTALWQVVTGDFITIDHRASAWLASANYLSLYLVPVLLISTVLLRVYFSKLMVWLVGVILSLGVLAVYFAFSYGGWFGLVAGLGVIGLWQLRHYWQFWVGSIVMIGVAIATQLKTDRVAKMLDFKTQSSASVRLQVWATDWLMAREHWLAGIGLGQYPVKYPEFVIRLFPSPLEPNMLHAHNLYLQFIINLGVLGLISFAWLIVKFFVMIKRADGIWVGPLTAGMVAILAHGLVDTPYWKNDLSLIFWLIMAMAVLVSRSPQTNHHLS